MPSARIARMLVDPSFRSIETVLLGCARIFEYAPFAYDRFCCPMATIAFVTDVE